MSVPTGRGITKHCFYEGCKNDNRTDESLNFIPFAKACLPARRRLIKVTDQHIQKCIPCRKCKKWIDLCIRKQSKRNQIQLRDIRKDTYLCSKHFVDPNGPSETHPNPVSAAEITKLRQTTVVNTTVREEMPKPQQPPVRTPHRRAASKEALKQMHILLGEEKNVEISSEDDDVIAIDPPPKKKYKVSHRKSADGNDRDVIVLKTVNSVPPPPAPKNSSDNIFEMEVEIEELSPAQKARRDQVNKEEQEIEAKLKELMSAPNTEVAYNGVYTTALELSEQFQQILNPPPQPAVGAQQIVLQQGTGSGSVPQSYQLVMDPRLGVIVGTVATTPGGQSATTPLLYQTKMIPTTNSLTPVQSVNSDQNTMQTRRGTVLRQVSQPQITQVKSLASPKGPMGKNAQKTPQAQRTVQQRTPQQRTPQQRTPQQKPPQQQQKVTPLQQQKITPQQQQQQIKTTPQQQQQLKTTSQQQPQQQKTTPQQQKTTPQQQKIMPPQQQQKTTPQRQQVQQQQQQQQQVQEQQQQQKATPQNKIGPKSKIQVKPYLGKPPAIQINASVQNKAPPIAPKTNLPAKPTAVPAQSNVRPSENNVEGGLNMGGQKPKSVVDLTTEDGRPLPDSREVSFNKLQGRTYPSLVVVARPHLRVKDLASDRGKLDVKVKSVLMYPPTKFTEWLIQQGLVRSDQKCTVHPSNTLKLGMYSDASKFPYSGGYVWISECCPARFISVFSGSIFEGSQHPPMSILKLMYHWSCQTIVQNVTQWVKVDNLFVKGMFTWLRAICTTALHTHVKQLGGPGIKVQVGVISLGTTSQDGNQRQVKVEVLGILETNTKRIRLRAIEPLTEGERNFKKRFSKILEPVYNWVHQSSTIVTDLTVDKATLNSMGFLHVTQSTSTDYNNSNRTIMEYLRRIVPRMFQNTLSLLSRQIIQQFLDELVWREWYGTTVLQCFDNLVQHLSEQTRHDTSQSLIVRLNKVVANPFKNWSLPEGTAAADAPSTPAAPKPSTPEPSASTAGPKRYQRTRKPNTPKEAPSVPVQAEASFTAQKEVPRPAKSTSPDVPEQLVPLENYYYGTMNSFKDARSKLTLNITCQICKTNFSNNIALMGHLFKHAHNITSDVEICRYCLTCVPSGEDLTKHVAMSHADETKFENGFVCLICEMKFMNPFVLGKHMSKEHCPSELPYMCGTCTFRCSNHKQAVDHFYQHHDHGTTIQCPFCLKSSSVYTNGRNVVQNLNYFIQHLRKHQKKESASRCGRCNLWFIQKEYLKDHQAKMHLSQRGKNGMIPRFAPRNGIMVPKSKTDKCPDDAKVINFSTLVLDVDDKNLTCKECSKSLTTQGHFASPESCQNSNCQYSTCCSNAMLEHPNKCKTTVEHTEALPYEMFCICGYSGKCGNSMAKHLAICERKTAYPSKEAAKSATVTHSMLDVLGLVRNTNPNTSDTLTAGKDVADKENNAKVAKEMNDKDAKKPSETKIAAPEPTRVSRRTGRARKQAQKVREVPEDTDVIEVQSDDSNGAADKSASDSKVNSVKSSLDGTEEMDTSVNDLTFGDEGNVTVIENKSEEADEEGEEKGEKEVEQKDEKEIEEKDEKEVEEKGEKEVEAVPKDDDVKEKEDTSENEEHKAESSKDESEKEESPKDDVPSAENDESVKDKSPTDDVLSAENNESVTDKSPRDDVLSAENDESVKDKSPVDDVLSAENDESVEDKSPKVDENDKEDEDESMECDEAVETQKDIDEKEVSSTEDDQPEAAPVEDSELESDKKADKGDKEVAQTDEDEVESKIDENNEESESKSETEGVTTNEALSEESSRDEIPASKSPSEPKTSIEAEDVEMNDLRSQEPENSSDQTANEVSNDQSSVPATDDQPMEVDGDQNNVDESLENLLNDSNMEAMITDEPSAGNVEKSGVKEAIAALEENLVESADSADDFNKMLMCGLNDA